MCQVCYKLTGSNKNLMRNAQVDFRSQCRVLIPVLDQVEYGTSLKMT